MDKFFGSHSDIPALPKEQLDQMTELALSHRQHAPGNENVRGSVGFFGLFQQKWWVGALSAAACIVLTIGVMSGPQDIVSSPDQTASVQSAQNDELDADAYSDITELAILDTLDTY